MSSDLVFPNATVPAVSPLGPPTPLMPQPGVSVPALLNIESDFIGATETTAFAEDHAAEADNFIQQLGALAASLTPPTVNPVYPTNALGPAVTTPPAPAVVPIVYTPPPVPAPFTGVLDDSYQFPDFLATPPQLLFPNAPAAPLLTLPSPPSVDLNFTYPTVDVTLPAPPDLLSLTTYQFNGVTLPTLTAQAPVISLGIPNIVPYIANAPYTDALLSELQATLQDRITNGTNTGLPAAVEQNLWDRAREREYKQAADSLAQLDRMEAMGYAFPPGVFVDAQVKIYNELGYTSAGLSRDIAIKQAELIHDDIVKALETATAIEQALISYQSAREQREFEATKYATEAGIAIYNAQVGLYAQAVNVYRAAIEVYNAQIQGQLAYIEAYKAELQAEQIKAEINTQLVQQYKVQVDAALATIEIFKGEIEIVQVQAQVQQIGVQIFGEEVKAYAAQVNAYQAQIEAYKAQLESQQTLENVYATQAKVYQTEVEAVSTEINANIAAFKALLDAKVEEYQAYTAQVQGQAAQVNALAAENKAIADIYTAEVSGTSAYNDAIIKEWQAALDESVQITQIGVAAAQANAQLYLTTKSIATDAAKVGAQVEAQIAASALGAVTYATHRARQDNVGISEGSSTSYSNSNSTSFSNSNSTSQSGAGQNSNQTSQSLSDSENLNYNYNYNSAD